VQDDNASTLTTRLLACGAVGGFGFVAAAAVEGMIRPDYHALHQPVSMLSLGAGGWRQIANFVITGLLMVAFARGLRRALPWGAGAKWGPILIGIYGLGLIAAGVFPADPGFGYPPGAHLGPAATPSAHGTLHNLVSLIVFVSLSAACFVFARRFASQSAGRLWVAYSVVSGVAVPAFLVAAIVAWSNRAPVNFGGVFQRLSIGAGWVWVALLAIRITHEHTVESRAVVP